MVGGGGCLLVLGIERDEQTVYGSGHGVDGGVGVSNKVGNGFLGNCKVKAVGGATTRWRVKRKHGILGISGSIGIFAGDLGDALAVRQRVFQLIGRERGLLSVIAYPISGVWSP